MKGKQVALMAVGVIVLSGLGFAGYQQFLAPTAATPTPAPQTQALDEVISAQGFVVPARSVDLAFRSGGRVAEVLIHEGDQVKQGQALIRLQDDQLQAGVAQAQATLSLAQATLAQVQDGARPEEIAAAEATLRTAQAQIGAASAERDRLTGGATDAAITAAQARLAAALVDQKVAQDNYDKVTRCFSVPDSNDEVCPGLGTPEEQARAALKAANDAVAAAQSALNEATKGGGKQVQAAQSNVAAATAQRDLAQARLDQVKAGATTAQIDVAQAGVAQAQAAVDAANAALSEATLIAPFDGAIAQISVEAGQVVGPGSPIVSLADLNSWEVETDDLSEVDIVNVRIDQTVALTLDALPEVKLNGTVIAITPKAQTKRGDVTYTVKVRVNEADARLKWGMTAQVEIKTK
ncbi:MAG: efflux RND transporter periplasmic adaptor subunit [Chloroflexi bacterium]|nr:efflux RND transporter periplasmic adaptor subunit [Chloroflexota bacterium]